VTEALLLIDGVQILPPDADVQLQLRDLEDCASGLDESGFLHRRLLRSGLKGWSLRYSFLSRAQYRYMESLFAGKAAFTVTYVDADGGEKTCTAYRTHHTVTVYDARRGWYRSYGFDILQC